MLENCLILDLTSDLAAYGPKLLADLGVRVIKVEPPGGDPGRRRPPLARTGAGLEESLDFAYLNSNKWGVTLNLETAAGRQLLAELAARADALCETFERRELERLGIGYEELSRRNPGLVWVSATPFGRSGPRRDWRGSDLIGWAGSGLLFATGDPDRPPLLPGGPARLAYMLAGLNCAAAVLLGLRARRLSGRGQEVEVSLQEAALVPEVGVPAFLDDLLPRRRTGSRRPASAPSGLYPCRDGYAAVVVTLPRQWDAFAAWVREELGIEAAGDPVFRDRYYRLQARELVDAWCEELTSRYTRQELFLEGQRRGVPVTPVNTVAELLGDPHLEARGYWHRVEHPVLGRLRMAGPPYRFSAQGWRPGRAPLLGEHNRQVYCGLLGMDPETVERLRLEGVI